MKKRTVRIVALLLCLAMLPSCASASAWAIDFSVSFSMDADAYPEDQRDLLRGFADALNMLEIQGSYDCTSKGMFRIDADVILNADERTRTAFSWYGRPSHWKVESSLFGDESIIINVQAMAEFAMKSYFHLDLHLQHVVLVIAPFVTKNAFSWIRKRWKNVVYAAPDTHTVSKEDLLRIADYIQNNHANARSFCYWLDSIFLEVGLSDTIREWLDSAYSWADQAIGDDGLEIVVGEDSEQWRSNGRTLYVREGGAWRYDLPAMPDGSVVSARSDGETIELGIDSSDGRQLISAKLTMHGLPERLPFEGKAWIEAMISGSLLADPVHLRFDLESDGKTFKASQSDPESRRELLGVKGTWSSKKSSRPGYKPKALQKTGVNILSVNDNTLPVFVKKVLPHFVRGMIPLLVQLPASSYQSVYDFLTDHGILDLLMSGVNFGEGADDEGYDPEPAQARPREPGPGSPSDMPQVTVRPNWTDPSELSQEEYDVWIESVWDTWEIDPDDT